MQTNANQNQKQSEEEGHTNSGFRGNDSHGADRGGDRKPPQRDGDRRDNRRNDTGGEARRQAANGDRRQNGQPRRADRGAADRPPADRTSQSRQHNNNSNDGHSNGQHHQRRYDSLSASNSMPMGTQGTMNGLSGQPGSSLVGSHQPMQPPSQSQPPSAMGGAQNRMQHWGMGMAVQRPNSGFMGASSPHSPQQNYAPSPIGHTPRWVTDVWIIFDHFHLLINQSMNQSVNQLKSVCPLTHPPVRPSVDHHRSVVGCCCVLMKGSYPWWWIMLTISLCFSLALTFRSFLVISL